MMTKQKFLDQMLNYLDASMSEMEPFYDFLNDNGYVDCHWQHGFRFTEKARNRYTIKSHDDSAMFGVVLSRAFKEFKQQSI